MADRSPPRNEMSPVMLSWGPGNRSSLQLVRDETVTPTRLMKREGGQAPHHIHRSGPALGLTYIGRRARK
jgi:hypothetical protein